MNMSSDAIEEFGKRLVQECRDHAIWAMGLLLRPDRQGKDAERWRAAAAAGGRVLATMVIPDSVDSAIAGTLRNIDQEIIRLSFTTVREEIAFLPANGEMCGWYGGTNGWRTWYSKERIVDADDWADFSAKLSAEHGTEGIPDDPPPIVEELPMPERAVQEFAQLLMHHVRDVAIQSCDLQLLPHSQTPTAKRWRRAAIPFNGQVPPQVLIPDCVDEAIYAFLHAIDQGLLPLSYVSENGETVDLVKEGRGELAPRYMAPDGWRAKYSKERINEDVAD